MKPCQKDSEHATREQLEAELLRRLMLRDARVYAERMEARDTITAHEPVRRQNPQLKKAPRPSLSIFEAPASFGSL